MTETLPARPAFLDLPTFLPRVTQRDGRAIEQALAGPTLFDRGVKLEGAVVEATYAAEAHRCCSAWPPTAFLNSSTLRP
jgi:hypothetical protein